jgi:quinol monooxygenase YgiN
MIVEIAKFQVKPDQALAFEAASQIGQRIFSEAPGCIAMELRPCVEQPSSFTMLVLWNKLEDHTEVFRNSKAVQEWRAAIGPFLAQPSEILNFGQPIVRAGAEFPGMAATIAT